MNKDTVQVWPSSRPTIIDEVRPPWSEVYRWQRRAAISALIACIGWIVVGLLLVVMVVRS